MPDQGFIWHICAIPITTLSGKEVHRKPQSEKGDGVIIAPCTNEHQHIKSNDFGIPMYLNRNFRMMLSGALVDNFRAYDCVSYLLDNSYTSLAACSRALIT